MRRITLPYRIQSKSRHKILQELLSKGCGQGRLPQTAWDAGIQSIPSRMNEKILKEAVLQEMPARHSPGQKGDAPPSGIPAAKRLWL